MQQVHEEQGIIAVDYTKKEGGEGLEGESVSNYDMETFGTVVTEEKMSLATNDPVKIADALGASIITRNDALGQPPTGRDTIEIVVGERPIEGNRPRIDIY
jgi:queuine/archaeosine tRNA-ribosyltransferase